MESNITSQLPFILWCNDVIHFRTIIDNFLIITEEETWDVGLYQPTWDQSLRVVIVLHQIGFRDEWTQGSTLLWMKTISSVFVEL